MYRFGRWYQEFVRTETVFGSDGCYHVAAKFEVSAPEEIPPERRLAPEQVASGQGTNARDALRKARAEAAERYSVVYQGSEPRVAAALSENEAPAISPTVLGQFSEAQ